MLKRQRGCCLHPMHHTYITFLAFLPFITLRTTTQTIYPSGPMCQNLHYLSNCILFIIKKCKKLCHFCLNADHVIYIYEFNTHYAACSVNSSSRPNDCGLDAMT